MKLAWNNIGDRTFEVGVDRGVLYLDDLAGVSWNGLVSVSESPTGGEVQPYYVDGIKYLNVVSDEEFEATIEAYTYPEEFEQCDGTTLVNNGLFVTQQDKKSFGMSYRTKIGNDVDGVDHGYKIHLVYDATAAPTERPNNSLTDTVDISNFSWAIVTKAPTFVGYKPTSHFIISSLETPSDLLAIIEKILYGSVDAAPRLPSIPELLFIFNNYNSSIIDAGFIDDPYYDTIDASTAMPDYTATIDGGTP